MPQRYTNTTEPVKPLEQAKKEDEEDEGSTLSERNTRLIVAELFYPMYRRFFEGTSRFNKLKEELNRANIGYPVEIYASGALGYGMIVAFLVGMALALMTLTILPFAMDPLSAFANQFAFSDHPFIQEYKNYLIMATYITVPMFVGLFAAAVGGVIATGILLYYPSYRSSRRARQIDLVLGDAIAFAYSLSVGGTNQVKIMEKLANAEDTYGEASVEFQRIVFQMRWFNTDFQTAVTHVVETTPSDELSEFLDDMLSIINSGGDMTTFLKRRHEEAQENAKRKQEEVLDTMELFGEMYTTLNLLPIGLIVVLVIMSSIGSPQTYALTLLVYGLIPLINVAYLIMVSTVKQDEVGNGKLDAGGKIAAQPVDETKINRMSVISEYLKSEYQKTFKKARRKEFQYRLVKVLRSPGKYFKQRPVLVLTFTIPLTLLTMLALVVTNLATLDPDRFIKQSYSQTVLWIYFPVLFNLIPLTIFYEWRRISRGEITDSLTDDLRKLANANETGQPVLEAMKITSEGSDSLLSDEIGIVYSKAQYGTNVSDALIEFNNRYLRPRLARTIKLVQKAQEASSNITEVLQTAAKNSRYQDEIYAERKKRLRTQIVITGVTFLIFLGVILALDVFFVSELLANTGEGGGLQQLDNTGGGQLDGNVVSLLFFHAVTVQAIFTGLASGYGRTGKIRASYKYIILYMMIALLLWGAGTAI